MPAGTMHASGMDNKPSASTYVAHAFAGKIRRPGCHIMVRRATDIRYGHGKPEYLALRCRYRR